MLKGRYAALRLNDDVLDWNVCDLTKPTISFDEIAVLDLK